MKLLRYGAPREEKPGLLDTSNTIRDLSDFVADIGGETLLPESLERLRKLDTSTLPKVEGTPRLGPCVAGVGKFICVGLNYSDHAAESGMKVPVRTDHLHEGHEQHRRARRRGRGAARV